MKNMVKQFFLRGVIGIGIGCFISSVIAIIIMAATGNGEITLTQYALNTIAGCVMGFVFAGSSVLFQQEKIQMLWATVIHFVILTTTYYAMAFMAGWVEPGFESLFISFSVFVGSYIAVWCSVYFSLKVKIKKINVKIEQNNIS